MARKGTKPSCCVSPTEGNVRIVCGAELGQDCDALHVVYPEGQSEALSSAQIARCSLLTDISKTSGLAELPFSAREFRLWQKNTYESNVGLDEACTVLKVAEFLQDCNAPHWAKFTAHLFSGCCGDVPRGCRLDSHNVVALHQGLSDFLMYQVLHCVKLRLVLSKAPAALHEVAVASRIQGGQHVSFAKELLGPTLPQALSLIPSPKSITYLDLSWNAMDNISAAALAYLLQRMPQLSHLDASCNSMGDQAANILSPGLARATALTSLSLRQNSLWSSGVRCVAQAVRHLKALQVLDLSENEVRVVSHDAGTWPHTWSQRNAVSDAGLMALQEALPRLSVLRDLDLSGNMISREGISILACVLPQLCKLRRLNLAHNNLGARGCEILMSHLPNVPALEEVNISTNHFEAAGGETLWSAVTRMTTLRSLKVLQNGLGVSALSELRSHIAAGRLPPTLQELDMRLNGVPREEAVRLHTASNRVVRCI